MARRAAWSVLLGLATLLSAAAAPRAGAQGRTVDGRVQRPGVQRPVPVPRQWVVLHRVGNDRAGPLDSVRSDATGRFRFRYVPAGDPEALYFVSTTWLGIAYFSAPLRRTTVSDGDADLLVYDTTSNASHLRVQGRHVVVSAARDAKREITEVFEIENDGNETVVAGGATNPLWAAPFPAQAEGLAVMPGDLGAGAVVFRRGRGELYAPISPGVRQLVVSYRLPARAFPLTLPVDGPVSVLEVLLEEPRAAADGAGLGETSPVSLDGRNFRRFLSRDVPPGATVRIRAANAVAASRGAVRVAVVVLALAMAGALAWRLRGPRAPAATAPGASAPLIAELATLDARFERARATAPVDASAQDAHTRARAALKGRIADALAVEQSRA